MRTLQFQLPIDYFFFFLKPNAEPNPTAKVPRIVVRVVLATPVFGNSLSD